MILNDIQIRRYCIVPEYWMKEPGTNERWPISSPYSDFEKACIDHLEKGDRSRLSPAMQSYARDCIERVTPEEKANWVPMIDPFINESISEVDGNKVISYGLSSFGYDLRIAPEFKIFTNVNSGIIDPKDFDHKNYVAVESDVCVIPPNTFVLTRALEKLNMPDDVIAIVTGKSTIARTGIQTYGTPAENGWKGYLTLEYSNTTSLPAKLYANEGGLQLNFFRGKRPETTYAERKNRGKYQDQPAEVVFPKV